MPSMLSKPNTKTKPEKLLYNHAKANLLGGNPLQALGAAGQSAQQAAEVGAKLSSNVGGFFKSLW